MSAGEQAEHVFKDEGSRRLELIPRTKMKCCQAFDQSGALRSERVTNYEAFCLFVCLYGLSGLQLSVTACSGIRLHSRTF